MIYLTEFNEVTSPSEKIISDDTNDYVSHFINYENHVLIHYIYVSRESCYLRYSLEWSYLT